MIKNKQTRRARLKNLGRSVGRSVHSLQKKSVRAQKRACGAVRVRMCVPCASVVAKQLGLDLHELGNKLPLYDGVTGEMVDELTDARVERARDTLMDRARLRVDRQGLEATAGVSLAEVIEDELEQQFGDKAGVCLRAL